MADTLAQPGKFTKLILITALILIFYGYLCRLINCYYFWESKSAGWALLLVGIIAWLYGRIRFKRTVNKETSFEKVGIGFSVFILLLEIFLIAIIPRTDAYSVAKKFLFNDMELRSEIGAISGFGFIPTGGMQQATDARGEYGNATINLIVKGEKRFMDITIYVAKDPEKKEWVVEGIE